MPIIKTGYTKKDLRNLFLDFFSDLLTQKENESEFSLLGYYMIIDFDAFFLKDIELKFGKEMKRLVSFAYSLFIDNENVRN